MKIRNFPTSPQPTHCLPEFVDYKVSQIIYEDMGMDYNLDQIAPQRQWTLEYNFLDEDGAAILDAHYQDAQGATAEFYFTDPHTGETFPHCRYAQQDGFTVEAHQKKWSPKRKVVIRQRLV